MIIQWIQAPYLQYDDTSATYLPTTNPISGAQTNPLCWLRRRSSTEGSSHGVPICSQWTTFSTTDCNPVLSSLAHRERQSGREAWSLATPTSLSATNYRATTERCCKSYILAIDCPFSKYKDENTYNTLVTIWPRRVNKQPVTAAIIMQISRELLRPSGNPLLWLASTSASWEGVDEASFPSCRCLFFVGFFSFPVVIGIR